jgi:probable F420-dependent oxidoreductase
VADQRGSLGVWAFTDSLSATDAAGFAARVEQLGYSTLWLPETVGRDPFAHIAHLAGATTTMAFATGIANIYNRHAGSMAQATNTLAEQTGNRFVLGLGVSHEKTVVGLRGLDYSRPLSRMRSYLDELDAAPYAGPAPSRPAPRLLAALGPKMLALAAERADGTLSFTTTPEHTAEARSVLGPDKLLCVEQKVVLSADPAAARATARSAIKIIVRLPGYRACWRRLGFTETEMDGLDDRFVDALVACGEADALRARVQGQLDAGASHVCVQPLSPDGGRGPDLKVLEALSPAAAHPHEEIA